MPRYILEAVLYDDQRLLSPAIAAVNGSACARDVEQLRGLAMVENVCVIDIATGEVVVDLPSYACLARAPMRPQPHDLGGWDDFVPASTRSAA